ncbi:hypothetical protein [Streptomyces spirodelae]|uniref:Magnesium transporter n=1 Tax=Streptomyces spirodelae TaxID=2812904 RepID=A0ABS3WWP0_9ACTN|nr:hypothetical protein [Streptomyces spirodelae]MBO8187538.1 hypothetical protein [Streptomyces spirodelae]
MPTVEHPLDDDTNHDVAEILVGVVASPGMASELVRGREEEFSHRMAARVPHVRWTFRCVSERLTALPTDVTEMISIGRQRLLQEGWDLTVLVTDAPLETARRPVVAHASVSHSVAVVSMPALGAVAIRRRLAETVIRLAAALVGDVAALEVDQHGAVARSRLPATVLGRVRELGHKVDADDVAVRMVARVVAGNIRLLSGMLRANRPWRLSMHLTRASVTALGTAALALVTSDIWRLGDALGPLRLSLITVASILTTACTLIVGAQLWERSPRPQAREQVIMFNVVTVATVGIGVLALYATLLLLTWIGSMLLIPSSLLADALQHPVSPGDQWQLVWLTSSLATVGEAVGAGWESNEAVREAAYTYRWDEQSLPEERGQKEAAR